MLRFIPMVSAAMDPDAGQGVTWRECFPAKAGMQCRSDVGETTLGPRFRGGAFAIAPEVVQAKFIT
jgi:hypothetical protein